MMQNTTLWRFTVVCFFLAAPSVSASDGDLASDLPWSAQEVSASSPGTLVKYEAAVAGGYLFVRATHKANWHTYAMDNKLRAEAALDGKKSLGVEQGTKISVEGLTLEDAWLQSKPHDYSKPELRWFTYGFEKTALFACPVKATEEDPVTVVVRAQVCSGQSCRPVRSQIVIPANSAEDARKERAAAEQIVESLISVRK